MSGTARFVAPAVAALVLLPTTLAAGFYTLLGAGFAAESLRDGRHVLFACALLVLMAAGWFGLVTAWRLYYALRNGNRGFNRAVAWAGLATGSAVSIALMFLVGGSLGFRLLFFGWPLLAAAFFAAAIRSGTRAEGL